MREHLHNNRGFTLIELLMAMALSTLVVTGLMSAFWFGNLFIRDGQEETDARYSVRQAMEHITGDIRQCQQVQLCDQNNQPVADGQIGKRLRLTLSSNKRVDYYLYPFNNTLYRYNLTDSNNVPVAMFIKDLNLLYLQPGLLDIELTALAGDRSYLLHTAVHTRTDVYGDW
ncbi:MAG: PilW family protein [Methylocystaceae bacterium]